jgi:hypothetical protein
MQSSARELVQLPGFALRHHHFDASELTPFEGKSMANCHAGMVRPGGLHTCKATEACLGRCQYI